MASTREFWNRQADRFDVEPDHGLTDPRVRAAWLTLLSTHLPAVPSDVIDLGCGTGSLAMLAVELGHRVRGLDVSEAMVAAASRKATSSGFRVDLTVGDAARPPYADHSADVVLCRHVLWAMPDPEGALRRWGGLARPDGRLLLIEGRWHTGAGMSADAVLDLLRQEGRSPELHPLDDESYWGRPIADERYLVVA